MINLNINYIYETTEKYLFEPIEYLEGENGIRFNWIIIDGEFKGEKGTIIWSLQKIHVEIDKGKLYPKMTEQELAISKNYNI